MPYTKSLQDSIISAMVNAFFQEENIKNNQGAVRSLIMAAKVNLLLCWSLLIGKIASYLKSSGKPHVTLFGSPLPESKTAARRMIFDLPVPLEIVDEKTGRRFSSRVCEYYITTPDAPDEYNQTGPVRLLIKFAPVLLEANGRPCLYDHHYICKLISDARDKLLREIPLYKLFLSITPYKSISHTCHFFKVDPKPYASYGKAVGLTEETFPPTWDDEEYWKNKKACHSNCSEAVLIEKDLNAVINNEPDACLRPIHSKACEGFFKQVFFFNDSYGYPIMAVIKQLEFSQSGPRKKYIPIVQLRQNGNPDSQYATLPLPTTQILYNLDKIPEAEVVVICPNLEIADSYQSVNSQVDIVFTALISDTPAETDLQPINGKEVCVMSVNHSGLSSAEALLESKKLYDYLLNNGKQKELYAVQAHINYAAIPSDIGSIGEYMNFRRSHAKARITPESIILMSTPEDFEERIEWAENEKLRKETESQDKPYWTHSGEAPITTDISTPIAENKNEQLFYPIIGRGAITYVAGKSGIGKSNIIASLMASLVNTSQRRPEIFPERCWSKCKLNNGYERLKILHLDLESGSGGIKNREKHFVDPYLPDDKEFREQCKANYIVKDLLNDATNYAEEAYWEDLCKMIEDATNEGNPGQPVDILIIDTFQSFTQDRDCDHWIFKKLIERYPRMAIVVLHHLDDDGKFVGLQAKKRIAQVLVTLTRDKARKTAGEDKDHTEKALTLCDNFLVQVKNCKLPHVPEDEEIFEARFDENNRFVVVDSVRTKAGMIKIIKEGLGISKEALGDLLGMGEDKLTGYLAGEKSKKK